MYAIGGNAMSLLATVADGKPRYGGCTEKTDDGRLLPEPPVYGTGGYAISLLATVAEGKSRKDDGLNGGNE